MVDELQENKELVMAKAFKQISSRKIQTYLVCACAILVISGNLFGLNLGVSVLVSEFFSPTDLETFLPTWLMYVLGGFIMCFGVPHGALDFDLAIRKIPLQTWTRKCSFILLYILIASICVVLWFCFPAFTLCVFLAISIWHFAKDWETYLPTNLSLLTAVWILTLPALLQPDAFVSILAMLWISSAEGQLLGSIFSALTIICSILLLLNWRLLLNRGYAYCFEIAAYLLLLLFSHILVFFTVYFCVVHSATYLKKYYKNITSEKRHLLTQIFGIMLLTTILGVIIIFFSNVYGIESHFYTWLFVGLFALTVPHMLLVERYFNTSSENLDGAYK